MRWPAWNRALSGIATTGLVAATLIVPPLSVSANELPDELPTDSVVEAVEDSETGPSPESDSGSRENPFIVVADRGVSAQELKARAVALGVSVESLLEGVVEGVAVTLTPQQRAELSVEPGVDYIEPDVPVSISSSAIRADSGCTANSMGNVDDASTGPVSLGFAVNWFGTEYNSILINNNGGISFDDGLGDFRSFNGINLDTTFRPLVLPLFTDIDTTNSSPVTYGPIVAEGQAAYCINWVNVGEYPGKAASQSFQLVIINRGSGDVDLEFNYGRVSTPSSTSNPTFVVGYADPNGRTNSLIRVRNTDSPSPYIDGGSNSLVYNRFPSSGTQAGRYTYVIDPADPVTPPTPVTPPNPGTSSCTSSPQTPVTWGLDRIDQTALPLSNSYTCAGDASGVRAYVVDTGIYANSDFSARMASGVSLISGSSSTSDCNGHGTHVAGTIGGTKYGVAKAVTLVPVRVLDCDGSGYTSWVVGGLNWIASQYDQPSDPLYGQPAVVNMSLGGGTSKSLDDAVASLVARGITVVVAAGNDNNDAQYYSPAREPSAITVGATTSTDARAYFSNYGTLVDIFAPGASITSTWNTGSSATNTISGTSMASPHVAGAAAVYLGLNPTATPSQVVNALTTAATSNVVSNPGTGSPNELLYARTFTTAPVITSLSPVSGSSAGGTTVALTGSNFTGATAVTVGGSSATSVSISSDTSLSFITPSGTAGLATIAVTNGAGTTNLSNAFTYTSGLCAVPTITSLSTSVGAAVGSTPLTITGSNFTGATSVTFGGKPAAFTVVSDTSITTTAPANTPSEVNVQVTTACGTNSGVNAFAYIGQPTISSLSVDGGPTSGGQEVIIYGSNFTNDSVVSFNSTSATSVTYLSASQLRVVSPSGSSGTVSVSVTTAGGTATAANAFSFYPAPGVSSLSPATGPTSGGTGVRLLGTNLDSTISVTVGGRSSTFFVFAQTELYFFTPTGTAGAADVVVTTLGGASTVSGAFTYTAAPQSGGGGSGGGSSSGSGSSSDGGSSGGGAPDDITPTENPVVTNQVNRPGEFKIVDSSGAPLPLRTASLNQQGFSIAGNDFQLAAQGPINSTSQVVTPGQRFTITGSGLQRLTTTGIYILSNPTWVGAGIVGYDGNFTASFAMPTLPPGSHTLQINMVRQGQLPVSIALGFTLGSGGATGSKPVSTLVNTETQVQPQADLVFFQRGSASLDATAKRKLNKLANTAKGASIAVTGFTTTGKYQASLSLAKKRATAIANYLKTKGVDAVTDTQVGSGSVQSRTALIRINAAPQSGDTGIAGSDSVESLIVRYKNGVKPSSRKPVTGTENVTIVNTSQISLGEYLGFRMYLLNFATPVSLEEANRVAAQISTSKRVEFAEPNGTVSTQVSIN